MTTAHDLTRRSAAEIGAAIAAGTVTAEALVAAYLDRIEALDRSGPTLQSVLAVNPLAVDQARALDAEVAATGPRGPLHGVPVLIKDNIETADPIPTTAGSLALAANVTEREGPAVAGLRAAGVVVMGKTNLSEWANFRCSTSVSGWSGVGGQVRNPHILDRTPCGSSSGSGAATAAYLAAASVGTETNGSIICPAAMNGIVGFKPTVGPVSQEGIVPIAPSQDTAGPMTRTVADAALLAAAMATPGSGLDALPPLPPDALAGRRLAVLRFAVDDHRGVATVLAAAEADLRAAGATLVDIDDFDRGDDFREAARMVLKTEFKVALNAYLAATPPSVSTRTLAQVIAFNATEARDRELVLFDQDVLELAEATAGLDDPEYLEARQHVQRVTGADGIGRLLAEHQADLLIAPSAAPPGPVDAINGDCSRNVGAGWLAAIAGYPHLTVPMGTVHAAPVGLSFIGPAGGDAAVLAAGHDYEVRTNHRPEPGFLPTAAAGPTLAAALAPALAPA
ncbi:MAG: amidase [Actinomycetota bacterium]